MSARIRDDVIARESSTGKRMRRVVHPQSLPLSLSLPLYHAVSLRPSDVVFANRCRGDLPENIGAPVMIRGSTPDRLESRGFTRR